jgi:transposase
LGAGRATRRLRELTGRRSALVGQRTALRNRIHATLAVRLIEAPARLFAGEGLTWLEGLELDAQGRQLVDSDLRQMQLFDQELAQLEEELARRGYQNEAVKLLMTLPGVDVTTAESLLAAWGDFHRFPDAAHAASYLGLTPSTKQSANQCFHGPITKLAKKKNRNVAVVAAARKLATIAWIMLTSNEPYRYAIPRATETKLARLRVKATGERRKGGSAKGTKSTAKLPGGSRTIKPLAEVYLQEGLPPARPLTAGEQRVVERTECGEFVGRIAQPQVVPRRTGTSTAGNAHRPRPAEAKPA